MNGTQKPDLRGQVKKARARLTPTNTTVEFAGDENRKVMPSSGRIVSPDPGNVVEGQNSKSN